MTRVRVASGDFADRTSLTALRILEGGKAPLLSGAGMRGLP